MVSYEITSTGILGLISLKTSNIKMLPYTYFSSVAH